MTDDPTRPSLNNVEQATMPLSINCGEYIAVVGHVFNSDNRADMLYAFSGLDAYLPPALIDRHNDTASKNYSRHIFLMVRMALMRYCRKYNVPLSSYQVTDIYIGYHRMNVTLPDIKDQDRSNAKLISHMTDSVHYDEALLTELGFYLPSENFALLFIDREQENTMSDPTTPPREPEIPENEGPTSFEPEEDPN